jgi:hypothetical protein
MENTTQFKEKLERANIMADYYIKDKARLTKKNISYLVGVICEISNDYSKLTNKNSEVLENHNSIVKKLHTLI